MIFSECRRFSFLKKLGEGWGMFARARGVSLSMKACGQSGYVI